MQREQIVDADFNFQTNAEWEGRSVTHLFNAHLQSACIEIAENSCSLVPAGPLLQRTIGMHRHHFAAACVIEAHTSGTCRVCSGDLAFILLNRREYLFANRVRIRLLDLKDFNISIALVTKPSSQSSSKRKAILRVNEGNRAAWCSEQFASHRVRQRIGADEQHKVINLVIL